MVELPALDTLGKVADEASLWLASRADVVVCLLDSQQQAIPDTVLAWLSRLPGLKDQDEGPELQFLLSKIDLVARESDQIRLAAKASRQLSDRLGRGFQVLTVASGDLTALLNSLDTEAGSATDLGPSEPSFSSTGSRRFDAASMRALRAVRARATNRLGAGLAALKTDCDTLAAVFQERRVRMAAQRQQSTAGPMRPKLLQLSAVLIIVAAVAPIVIDEDFEPWIVQGLVALVVVLAVLTLVLGLFLPASASRASSALENAAAEQQEAELAELARYLRLVRLQLDACSNGALLRGTADGDREMIQKASFV